MKQILNMLQKMNLFKKLVVFILLLSFFPTNLFAGIDYSKYDAIFLSEGEEVLKCTLGAIACFLVYFILHKSIYKNAENKPDFGAYATTAMFVGLCASYIGSYIGKVFAPGDGDWMPLVVAVIAGLCMAVFEYFTQKKNMKELDNFSLAASMLIAMAAAVVIQLVM